MNKLIILLVVALLCIISTSTLIAQGGGSTVPTMINYQGFLTDSGGTALTGTYQIIFRIYDESGGNHPWLWHETHTAVTVENGLFNVLLGSVDTLSAEDLSGDRFLAIKVENEVEMSPRMRLASVAYSLLADQANQAKQAEKAYTMNAADGDPADAVIVDNNGNVGIGTNSPESRLHVNGVTQAEPVCARWLATNHNVQGPADYEWGQKVFNSDSTYLSRTANNQEIEVKIAGYYMVCVNVLQSESLGARGDVSLKRNGTTISQSLGYSTGHIKHTLSIVEKFEVGDKISVHAHDGAVYGSPEWSSLEIYRLN